MSASHRWCCTYTSRHESISLGLKAKNYRSAPLRVRFPRMFNFTSTFLRKNSTVPGVRLFCERSRSFSEPASELFTTEDGVVASRIGQTFIKRCTRFLTHFLFQSLQSTWNLARHFPTSPPVFSLADVLATLQCEAWWNFKQSLEMGTKLLKESCNSVAQKNGLPWWWYIEI